jgi:hypothetical protein
MVKKQVLPRKRAKGDIGTSQEKETIFAFFSSLAFVGICVSIAVG